jgi:sulfopyruvate decarboxylase alpha subunit
MSTLQNTIASEIDWPTDIYNSLKQANVKQLSYVPDAGHTRLIKLSQEDSDIHTTVLTTEEEGIALCAGAWLGGQRPVMLMQSSGVGNCINMLSLASSCSFPLLMIITMRGEWEEFNPWQIAMGKGTPTTLEAMGTTVMRIDDPAEAGEVVASAATLAYEGNQQIAVLISQRMIGKKKW